MTSIAQAKAKYPDLAPLFDIDAGKAMEQVILREDAKLYGLDTAPTQGQGQMPAQTQGVSLVNPANAAKAADYRQRAAFAYSRGNEKIGKFFTDEAERLDPKEQIFFRDGKLVSTKSGLVTDFGGTRLLTEEEVTTNRLDPNKRYQISSSGNITEIPTNIASQVNKEQLINSLPNQLSSVYPTLQPRVNALIKMADGLTAEQINNQAQKILEDDSKILAELDPKVRALDLERRKAGKTELKVYTGDLSKSTATQVEQGALSNADAITRLNNIQYSYRPEYQNIKYRGKQAWNTLVDKGIGLPEPEKRQLAQYSQYKQNSLQNLNQTIKDITGAAMGVQEAERIIASLPNAGTGIFDGDSPTEFEAKLNNAVKQTKYALARKNYALKNGLKWENTSLDSMPKIIQSRGKEIEKQYNLNPEDPATKQIVLRQLAAEFGVAF
jgi:hypothetical protein